MPKITYFGYSCFLVEGNRGKIVIDPFFTDNPHVKVSPNEIIVDAVLVTNPGARHLGDALSICRKNQARLISTPQLAAYCQEQGIANINSMNIGGSRDFDFGSVYMTAASHSPHGIDGKYMGQACGYIVRMDGRSIYHTGATGLTAEFRMIAEQNNIDVLCVPIGDTHTMGPAEAATAVEIIKPTFAIPMQYKTYPEIDQDPADFDDKVGDLAKVKILNFGENFEI